MSSFLRLDRIPETGISTGALQGPAGSVATALYSLLPGVQYSVPSTEAAPPLKSVFFRRGPSTVRARLFPAVPGARAVRVSVRSVLAAPALVLATVPAP